MKKILYLYCLTMCLNLSALNEQTLALEKYKDLLERGTYDHQDWSIFTTPPKSRYHTFKYVFEHFIKNNGRVVVELGTSRSFTHGGHIGCNQDDTRFWTPESPENWDWGAGIFTRMAAESLKDYNPVIHTIDLIANHINRCKVMTQDFKNITYHVCSSLDFLARCAPYSIDLLYLDTGDMTPIEPTAQLQLAEAKIIVERNVLAKNGILLIDDVRNQTPRKFGETSGFGKSKYSIQYLLQNGYEIIADEYQVILRRNS